MNNLTTQPAGRNDARFFLGFKALFYTNAIEGSAVVANFSRGGAFLVTRANLRIGHALRLIVLLGNGGRQELSGEVVRCDAAGFAIEFVDDDDSREEAGRLLHNIRSIVTTRRVAEAIADLPPLSSMRSDRGPVAAVA